MVVEWLMGLLGLPRLNSETKWIHSHREVGGLIKGKRMETGSLYPCFFNIKCIAYYKVINEIYLPSYHPSIGKKILNSYIGIGLI